MKTCFFCTSSEQNSAATSELAPLPTILRCYRVRWYPGTPPPRSACVELDQPREGEGFPADSLLLVRIWPFFGRIRDRKWYLYLGHAQGIAPDSRRNERVKINVPSLGLRGAHAHGSAAQTARRLASPVDLEERGVTIQTVRVAEEMVEWLQGWDGAAVHGTGQNIQYPKTKISIAVSHVQP